MTYDEKRKSSEEEQCMCHAIAAARLFFSPTGSYSFLSDDVESGTPANAGSGGWIINESAESIVTEGIYYTAGFALHTLILLANIHKPSERELKFQSGKRA